MNLNEYIAELQALVEADPSLGDAPLVAFSDDEGNIVSIVNYAPTLAYADKEDIGHGRYLDNHLYSEDEFNELDEDGEVIDREDLVAVVVLV